MNERIQELLKKAQNIAAKNHTPGGRAYEREIYVKFAELIVKECVKEIEFQFGGGSDQPMDSEWDRAIECASSMVKHRFGVGE